MEATDGPGSFGPVPGALTVHFSSFLFMLRCVAFDSSGRGWVFQALRIPGVAIAGIAGHQGRAAELGRLKAHRTHTDSKIHIGGRARVAFCNSFKFTSHFAGLEWHCEGFECKGAPEEFSKSDEEASELTCCTHCWDWVPESSCGVKTRGGCAAKVQLGGDATTVHNARKVRRAIAFHRSLGEGGRSTRSADAKNSRWTPCPPSGLQCIRRHPCLCPRRG